MVQSAGDASDGVIVTPTESQIYAAFRAWLISILPSGMMVIQGQQNRFAPPPDPFAVMTIIDRERLALNGWTYGTDTRVVTDIVSLKMQIKLFGPASSNQMQTVTSLWRDMQAADYFRASGLPIAPLYTSNVIQLGFVTGERQYEDCWTVDLIAQVNISLTLSQDFATSIPVGVIEVDTTYPPEE